ncbi:MAG: HlyD family efflux transporter periplasmic adaptor subunit [Acutalibacteraceae bacterium]
MDKSSIIKKILMTLITILVLAYVVYVIVGANFNSIKTEAATKMTATNSISVSGYFIRDESLIQHKGNGVISYTVEDCSKVAGKETVAEIYHSSEDAAAQEEIDRLKERIATLETLEKSADMISLSPEDLDESVYSSLFKMKEQLGDGNILDVDDTVENIIYSINERRLVIGKTESFSSSIAELKKQVEELEASYKKAQTEIISEKAGYFVSFADGFENVVTSDDIENIYPSQLEELMNSTPKTVSKQTIGKTIDNIFWYIACPVTYEQALVLKNLDRITVSLPFALADEIPVTVVSVNQETKTSGGVVILRGEYMNEELASARKETVVINIENYTGIYVNRKAVHEQELTKTVTDENGKETQVTESVMGVYVLSGNELEFKQIAVLYSNKDYLICSEDPKKDESDGVSMEIGIFSYDEPILKLYDNIVVEGANLYDGKLVT